MKIWVSVLFLSIIFCCNAHSQDIPEDTGKPVHVLQFELLGHGGLYSLNFERITTRPAVLRMGISYLNTDGFWALKGFTFPMSVTDLLATDKDSFAELGAFMTLSTMDQKFDVWVGPTFGFREQNIERGDGMVRFFFSPGYSIRYNKFFITGGLSFGKGL
ncbi:MAG TPA: hypothetical protein DF712_24105 [Balneola sp.]|jgi:hypothetical protein|nr:hypothetical protein [Bacteroidota bacterium]MAC05688.1 hypothetical protein [Balneola sp.]MAO76584.1 hypothetical protein [Balneola sp.]HBZ40134.1 hypothetical protein [Balneola sp.]HCT55539.1 hypothetical protein [Balneola sp.]|tara:strand:+ start:2206 stop:2685 length:480 start_codon:yes stop_codon:yes gene_type:complete